jgi:hypothetical protein
MTFTTTTMTTTTATTTTATVKNKKRAIRAYKEPLEAVTTGKS